MKSNTEKTVEAIVKNILKNDYVEIDTTKKEIQDALDRYQYFIDMDPTNPFIFDCLNAGMKLGLLLGINNS